MPPAKGRTPPSHERTPRQPGDGHPARTCILSHPRPPPAPPSPSGTIRPGPATTIPPASLPNCRKRIPRSWTAGKRLSLRTRTLQRNPNRSEAEHEVDLLTREFWPWIKGKWDDINNAIHWYKRNRGEWTRQLKNARAAREAEERRQAKPRGPGGQASPGIRAGRGGNRESPALGQQHTGRPRRQVAVGRGAGRPAGEAAPPDLRNMAETNGGRGLPGRPVHSGRPDSLRRGVAGKKNVPRIAEHPGKGGRPRAATAAAGPRRPTAAMTPRWGMMISRGTPQARITNHRITKQGVRTVSEGKAARVAGASVAYAAIRYRNAAKAARKRDESPLRDEVARARAGLLLSAAAAWHPLWLKWRASLGETHLPDAPIPPAKSRMGEVFQASKRFGFAVSQGNQSHTLAGQILRAAERLRRKDYTSIPWRKTPATEDGNRGRQPPRRSDSRATHA